MIFKYVLFSINGDTILGLALTIPVTASPGDPSRSRQKPYTNTEIRRCHVARVNLDVVSK